MQLKMCSMGEGPELVMLHGWAMHSGIWGDLAARLAVDFRVNLVDLPGHGVNHTVPLDDTIDTVAALLADELPTGRWLGWSLGGLLTMKVAMLPSQRVQSMVLVAATPSFCRRDNWPAGMKTNVLQTFSEGLQDDFEAGLNRFLVLETLGAEHARASLRRLQAMAFSSQPPARAALVNGLKLLSDSNLIANLANCDVPSLFLGGSRDRLVHPRAIKQAAALMQQATCYSIAGAGHAPFISHPDECFKTLYEFFAREQTA